MFEKINKLKKCLILNGIREMVTSGQDSTWLNVQLLKRNLKQSLEPGVVVHAYNLSIPKAEAGRSGFKASLIYRSGEQSLGSEGNH